MDKKKYEEELLKSILSHSLSSENPSEKTIEKASKTSPSFFNKYKNDLLVKYQDSSFDDFKNISTLENPQGEVIKITNKEKCDFNLKKHNYQKNLLENLKLINGIGSKTESKLKDSGYKTIEDLTTHPVYSIGAKRVLNNIEKNCFLNSFNFLKDNKISTVECASLLAKENFKFMDIETLGLSNVPIILIGIAEIKNNNIYTYQYLLKDKINEGAIISEYMSHLDEASILVTFNGLRFDEPFIKTRAQYYQINYNYNIPHYDLYYYSKKLWKDQLPNCKLQTIEKYIFGIERDDDVPGQFIPDYYETYLKEKNIGPLMPIIKHNRIDIVSLASFLEKIYNETCF